MARHRSSPVCGAINRLVVNDDYLPIARAVYIQLDVLTPHGKRQIKRRQCILRSIGRSPTMGDAHEINRWHSASSPVFFLSAFQVGESRRIAYALW
jgi:hypothetical protein